MAMVPCPGGDAGSAGERRLAAIAFLDIVGYSVLMASDEQRTHSQWMRLLNGAVRPEAARRRGKVIKSTGDGVLAEFPSVFDAVAWGTAIQEAASADARGGLSEPLALRIAVHVGDVIATVDDDIYGSDVNVTARLQEHAPPGGILLSEAAYELSRAGLDRPCRDLGLLQLKNFERPVRAYALDPITPPLAAPVSRVASQLPSIAVLPFWNGGDRSNDYFAEGIVEDVVLSLASLRELLVISRGSTLFYRGRQPDPREVGRALGVRYVLSGSIGGLGKVVMVRTELCDALTGATIWGDREEISTEQLFEVQDNIVGKIVSGIAPNVRENELQRVMRKRPDSFSAYDCTLRALALICSLEKDKFEHAFDFLTKAMSEDPNFAMPVAWAARWHSLYVGQGWSRDPARDIERALRLAARAIEFDSMNALALATYGHVQSFLLHQNDTALVYFDKALSACPNFSLAWALSSATFSYIGDGREAVRRAERAVRLSPFDQQLYAYHMFMAIAHYVEGNFAEGLKWARLSISENPSYTSTLRITTVILAALNRTDEARSVGLRLLEREPEFRVSHYAEHRIPIRAPEIRQRFVEHLRRAGLPE